LTTSSSVSATVNKNARWIFNKGICSIAQWRKMDWNDR
jgi:hypothetical protein